MLISCIYFYKLQLWLLPQLTTDTPDIHFLTERCSTSLKNCSYIYQQITATSLDWMYWYGWRGVFFFCCWYWTSRSLDITQCDFFLWEYRWIEFIPPMPTRLSKWDECITVTVTNTDLNIILIVYSLKHFVKTCKNFMQEIDWALFCYFKKFPSFYWTISGNFELRFTNFLCFEGKRPYVQIWFLVQKTTRQ